MPYPMSAARGHISQPAVSSNPAGSIVSGAGTSAANGLYSARGTFNGKPYYNLFGQPDSTTHSAIVWETGVEWRLYDAGGTTLLYSSPDAVAFPWLAAWNVSDGDSPAPGVSISTAVVLVVGGSQPGTYTYRGSDPNGTGQPYYNLIGHPDNTLAWALAADETVPDNNWQIIDGVGIAQYVSDVGFPFPWLAAWTGVTVTQS